MSLSLLRAEAQRKCQVKLHPVQITHVVRAMAASSKEPRLSSASSFNLGSSGTIVESLVLNAVHCTSRQPLLRFYHSKQSHLVSLFRKHFIL